MKYCAIITLALSLASCDKAERQVAESTKPAREAGKELIQESADAVEQIGGEVADDIKKSSKGLKQELQRQSKKVRNDAADLIKP
ncbi:hypothetical protein [Rubritalea tangerina]|uniref:YtxH domain-containing protein n=1 Tax=Rubritalea tangerina TaxID=430798 RepID=A0ABW4Z6X1_9BACT